MDRFFFFGWGKEELGSQLKGANTALAQLQSTGKRFCTLPPPKRGISISLPLPLFPPNLQPHLVVATASLASSPWNTRWAPARTPARASREEGEAEAPVGWCGARCWRRSWSSAAYCCSGGCAAPPPGGTTPAPSWTRSPVRRCGSLPSPRPPTGGISSDLGAFRWGCRAGQRWGISSWNLFPNFELCVVLGGSNGVIVVFFWRFSCAVLEGAGEEGSW